MGMVHGVCTPTYRGVYVGMVHSTCAYIARVIHPLIEWVYVGMVHGVCAYIIVVVHHPLIQGSKWVWYMVYVPIL